MTRGALRSRRRTCPCRANDGRERLCASFAPPTGIRSTPTIPRRPTSTTSTAIWRVVETRSPWSRRATVPARRRQLRRGGRGPVSDGAPVGPDLRPGGAGQGEPARPVRPPRGHGPLHGGPVPGDPGRGPGARRRRGARPLGDPHRPRRGARRAAARAPQRDHHARRRRLREPGAGLRFPDPLVRAAAAPLDAAPRGRAHRDHRGLPPARAARRRAGAVHPAHLQRHRPPPLQPLAQRQRAWIRASARR